MEMKLFLSLMLFGFCQFAFGAASVTSSTSQVSATCSISDASISKTSVTSTQVTYTFTHSVTLSVQRSGGLIIPECWIQISPKTQTNNIVGGWKFLNDINFSTSNNLNCSSILVTNQRDYSQTSIEFIKSLNFFVSNGNCQLSLSYSITLVADPNSAPGTNTLSPLISIAVEDRQDSSGFTKSLASISLGSVTPDPAPQSTCSLSAPSNLSLGNASYEEWRGDRSKRVNATNFDIRINCSQKLTTTFTPTVTMKFETPLGFSCLASNELTGADATNATMEIIGVVNGLTQPICPTNETPFTTLAFKVNDPASTPQPYSDSITLQAAFRARLGVGRPSTGIFSTRVTFTVKYE